MTARAVTYLPGQHLATILGADEATRLVAVDYDPEVDRVRVVLEHEDLPPLPLGAPALPWSLVGAVVTLDEAFPGTDAELGAAVRAQAKRLGVRRAALLGLRGPGEQDGPEAAPVPAGGPSAPPAPGGAHRIERAGVAPTDDDALDETAELGVVDACADGRG